MVLEYINKAFDFLNQHGTLVLIIGILAFGFWYFFLRNKKKELKPLSRSEIERKKFIDRMKLNKSSYRWLFRGNELLGEIKGFMLSDISDLPKRKYKGRFNEDTKQIEDTEDKEDKKDKRESPIMELVVKPVFNSFIKLPSPFKEEICLRVGIDTILDMNKASESIMIDEKVTFEKIFGIYYDRRFEPEMLQYVKVTDVMRTDLEDLGSEYYVESQKKSVISQDYGYGMAKAEKELQTELARKRGKQSTI